MDGRGLTSSRPCRPCPLPLIAGLQTLPRCLPSIKPSVQLLLEKPSGQMRQAAQRWTLSVPGTHASMYMCTRRKVFRTADALGHRRDDKEHGRISATSVLGGEGKEQRWTVKRAACMTAPRPDGRLNGIESPSCLPLDSLSPRRSPTRALQPCQLKRRSETGDATAANGLTDFSEYCLPSVGF